MSCSSARDGRCLPAPPRRVMEVWPAGSCRAVRQPPSPRSHGKLWREVAAGAGGGVLPPPAAVQPSPSCSLWRPSAQRLPPSPPGAGPAAAAQLRPPGGSQSRPGFCESSPHPSPGAASEWEASACGSPPFPKWLRDFSAASGHREDVLSPAWLARSLSPGPGPGCSPAGGLSCPPCWPVLGGRCPPRPCADPWTTACPSAGPLHSWKLPTQLLLHMETGGPLLVGAGPLPWDHPAFPNRDRPSSVGPAHLLPP